MDYCGRAQNAAEKSSEASAREKLELVLMQLAADKYSDKDYNQDEYIDKKLAENDMQVAEGDIVIVDDWQFEIDRNVPQIVMGLGKGQLNKEIKIELSQEVSKDYVKSTITAKVEYDGEIEYIQIAGEKNENVKKGEDQKYTISKEVLNNGKYSVYVRDTEGKYKYETIEVKEITENMNIDSKEKLIEFRNEVNKGRTYEGKIVQVTEDIYLEGKVEDQWIPIGTDETNFNGTFNGNNHTIHGLYINSTNSYQGLFKNIDKKAKIKNLTIDGEMTSLIYQGGFASTNYGTIENCTNNAKLNATGNLWCGGIVAANKGIIYKCINNGEIIANGEAAGGIAAGNGTWTTEKDTDIVGFIIECINNGAVTSFSWTSGGITALNGNFATTAKGYICNSYNTGIVNGGNDRRGGIVGQVKCRGGISYVYNCYNRGDILGCPEIIGSDWGGGDLSITQNNYGKSEATVEKLNVASDIEQRLIDTNLYRSNAWVLKDGEIALDWEK